MTFGYPSARYLLSQHYTHFGHTESSNSAEIDSILNRGSSQSPLPDEAYINLFDTVPYIFSAPTAVDVLAQHSPTPPTSGHLPDDADVATWTAVNSSRFEMNNSPSQTDGPPGPFARPRTAPPSSLLALFNSDNFDALAHRLQVPLSPELVGTMSREESRTLLDDDMETMLRLGHAVEGEPRTYREAWVGVPSDPEEDNESIDGDGGNTWTPPIPLSIDPHLRVPRRNVRPQPNTASASHTTTATGADDEEVPIGLNPFLSSNLDALNAFLSHLPPLSPSSGVTSRSSPSNINTTNNSFSHFRRRPMAQSHQPNDQPFHSNLRTISGAMSMLPDVPLSPLSSSSTHNSYALPSMGAYTHHVDSPLSPTASTSTDNGGMPHPGDMTVMDLMRKDPYAAHVHWEDVQAVARAERQRHLRHLGRYGGGQVEVSGGSVPTAEWEAKMIR